MTFYEMYLSIDKIKYKMHAIFVSKRATIETKLDNIFNKSKGLEAICQIN